MTLNELFEELPSALNAAAAAGINKVLQFDISGDESGVWAFEIADGVGRLIPGGTEEPDTTFVTTDETWIAVAEGRLDPMKAFMTGKLQVSGDMVLATKMQEFFPTLASADAV